MFLKASQNDKDKFSFQGDFLKLLKAFIKKSKDDQTLSV